MHEPVTNLTPLPLPGGASNVDPALLQNTTPSQPHFGESLARSVEMSTKVTVTIPREVNVTLVEVKSLQEYEVWTWVRSLLLAPVTGYFVAYSQSREPHLLVNAFIFGLLFVIALGRTIYTRWCLTKRSDTVRCNDTS